MGDGDFGHQPADQCGGAVSGAAFCVMRSHTSPLAVGPRPRLRPALEDAVAAVDERLGGRGRIVEGHALQFVWERRSPLTVLRETRVQASWQVSPSVFVRVDARAAASPAMAQAGAAPQRAAAAPVPMRLVTVERQLETRVVGRAVAALTEAARRPADATGSDQAPARPTAQQAAGVRAQVAHAPIAMRVPPPEMAVARSPRLPSVATTAAAATGPAAAALPAPRPPTVGTATGTALPIDRITTEVVRALDSRFIAWRERMGRP
jgi:hypothetical protein